MRRPIEVNLIGLALVLFAAASFSGAVAGCYVDSTAESIFGDRGTWCRSIV